MSNSILLLGLLAMLIIFINYKYTNKAGSAEPSKLTGNLELSQKLDKFLENSSYSEQIGTLNDKPVYKYIQRGDILYKFKDFLPRDNPATLFNDDALVFNHMHYVRHTT